MISTMWWQSQHMSYIDFVYLAAYRPRCVLSSYLKLPLNVWMLLNQLGKNHDLVFMYLIFQCLCHSFPSRQNLMLSCCSRFSSSVLSNLLTHSTFFTDSSCPLVEWQLNNPSNCVWDMRISTWLSIFNVFHVLCNVLIIQHLFWQAHT
jgi:hypothetical protein